jgi:thiol-disulfide isomerase/thioredoxin
MLKTRYALSAGLALGIAGTLAAQDATEQSMSVLERVVKSYIAAPGIDEKMHIRVVIPAFDPADEPGREEMHYHVTHGDERAARVDLKEFQVYALDGNMLMTRGSNSKYLRKPIERHLIDSFGSTFGSSYFLPVSLYARHEAGRDLWLKGLALGFLTEPKVSGFRTDAGDSGRLIEVAMTSPDGTVTAHIDPQTYFVTRTIVKFNPEGTPPEFVVDVDVQFTVDVKESGKELVAFDPGDREAVATLDDMAEKPIEVGEVAPTFTLTTLDGKRVALEDLRGEIVILDFWATWCGPCIMGLPKLQEFATYVENEKLPVRVYAVNVWESERDPDKRREVVRSFWETRKFTMPTLIDPDDKVVESYRVSGIPTMFVIDQSGKVANVHVGFDPDIAEVLKNEVRRLTQPAG